MVQAGYSDSKRTTDIRDLCEALNKQEATLEIIDRLSQELQTPEQCFEFALGLKHAEMLTLPKKRTMPKVVASYAISAIGGGIESALVALSTVLGDDFKTLIIAESDKGSDEDRSGIAGVSIRDSSLKEGEESRFETLARILIENDVDTLLYHAWFDRNLIWDALLCKSLGINLVLNTHGAFSHFLDVTDGTFASWNDGRIFALVPIVASICDSIVCETKLNKRFFSTFNPHSFAIDNTLPENMLELAKRGERHVHEDKPAEEELILWLGRFDIFKHPEDAVEILARVRESRPNAKLLFVGESGYETYETELIDLAKSLGIEEWVTLAGFQKDVDSYYARADVFLLTTEIEGYCMVLAEACAYGLPIVAYELPYLPFADCAGIRWVPQGDIEAASIEVSKLLADDSLRESLGRECRRFIIGRAESKTEDSWTDVFEDLAKAPSRFDIVDETMWVTLFRHYLRGAERTHAQIKSYESQRDDAVNQWQAAEVLVEECRREYEESYSYRIGRALLALPRAVSRLLRKN